MPHRLQLRFSLASLRLHLSVCLLILVFSSSLHAQVGIGTTSPKAFLNVPQGRTVLFGSDSAGAGGKLIWYGSKGAFRAGAIQDDPNLINSWDNTSVGQYSFASGLNTKANGYIATAFGHSTMAPGNYAVALNYRTEASGQGSVSMGSNTVSSSTNTVAMGTSTQAIAPGAVSMGQNSVARADNATAMGYYTNAAGTNATAIGESTLASGRNAVSLGYASQASGENAMAMGSRSKASGENAIALGTSTQASGDYSLAAGMNSIASGGFSTAIGSDVSTNGKTGSFILGDGNAQPYVSTERFQMTMRFGGGYKLYNSANPQASASGVELKPYQNAWSVISDSTRKENYRVANGASFLEKIARMRLGSWNYKGQDAKLYRHYGPMAQEFFAAFGHDELGIIGEDKSINQADFDGVNLIAIQALIEENQQLKARLAAMEKQ
ncbi:tail fiber domain-containing protein, partial [Spirosoma validum]